MAGYSSEQIADHYRGLILAGRVGAGDRLPTVRQIARDLDVALGTAAKAYKSLEGEGFIVSRGAAGTRVAERPSVLPGPLIVQLREAVIAAQACGTSRSHAIHAFQSMWDETAGSTAAQQQSAPG
ncbi:MAG: GntR family transcriptional regulator [Burkholderiaceae bacterium]|nr:GntR family transcriptional regulator [Microbacteriaceae bacterium]